MCLDFYLSYHAKHQGLMAATDSTSNIQNMYIITVLI